MNPKRKTQSLSESEIDRLVVAQSEDDSAWEKPVRVQKATSASVVLPSELSARAAFFARLHRESSVEDWLRRIVQERIELEEAAFAGVKREIATSSD